MASGSDVCFSRYLSCGSGGSSWRLAAANSTSGFPSARARGAFSASAAGGSCVVHQTAGSRIKETGGRFRHLHFASSLRRTSKGTRAAMEDSAGMCTPNANNLHVVSEEDLRMVMRAAEVACSSSGITMPHPNHGCILVSQGGHVVAESFLYAQGTESCESQAVRQAGTAARGACAYLNIECGDCHGDDAAVKALVCGGVSRVVIGLRHPAPHHRHQAIRKLGEAGVTVAVVGEFENEDVDEALVKETVVKCLQVNEALLHRVVLRRPMSILKYAMTLDGKIATTTGHSAWVSGPSSRAVVHKLRSQCDAVVVGGQTVRKDNCRLTTRQDDGHHPARIVLTRTMDLPRVANLWNVSDGPTIVCTEKGSNRELQAELRNMGVEVVEFEGLTPGMVADFCYARGFLQLLWECGGGLAAPTISDAVIHKAMVFIAPKMIGGFGAPTPIGDLGLNDMSQALELVETRVDTNGNDIVMTGYIQATSGGLEALAQQLDRLALESEVPGKGQLSRLLPVQERDGFWNMRDKSAATDFEFYKAWDKNGALTNFSPHPIRVPSGANGEQPGKTLWPSVEHYYQAQKLGGEMASCTDARKLVQAIAVAQSPEEAARIGRRAERERPELIVDDWNSRKVTVMKQALLAKFMLHEDARRTLLATQGCEVVEAAPHDFFWACGRESRGQNRLGRLLMEIRDWLLGTAPPPEGISCENIKIANL